MRKAQPGSDLVRKICWLVALLLFPFVANAANPVQIENAKAGTSSWQLSNAATNHEIEGYASLTSVNRGGQISFFVRTASASYTLEVFRLGWYGGAGGRSVFGPITRTGFVQPNPVVTPGIWLVECNWVDPYVLTVPNNSGDPTDWASGVYLVKLTAASGKQSYIIFVVRDDGRFAPYLFQCSVTTYQAYNNWGGHSLYGVNSINFDVARKVSFNRPYAPSPRANSTFAAGSGDFFCFVLRESYPSSSAGWECNMLRFLEREGYDVSYCTDVDTHANANLLLFHKWFLSVGHDEYWSWQMRTNVVAARDQGVNLGFFGGNICVWQIRFEPSGVTGAADRTMVGYKEVAATADPFAIDGNPSNNHLITTTWRTNSVLPPEGSFIGVMYESDPVNADIVIEDASNWACAGTGLSNGSHLPGLAGYEVDRMFGIEPPGTARIAHSPYTDFYTGQTRYTDMSTYTAGSGATVFATGSMQWNWGLDDFNAPNLRPSRLSAAAQQMTRNVLARSPTFVVGRGLGTLRNNFGGWVGMKLTVGATALTVTQLGRIFVSGNSGVHTVKLVRASDQADVPNGSVSITMSGGTAGQFKYGTLSSPVTLAANTAYYLVSQEVSGGDQWYDVNTTVSTSSAGSCNGGVYFSSRWSVSGNANNTYIPLDFKYVTASSATPIVGISATDATALESGSDTGLLTIMRTGSTATPLTVNYTVSGTATAGSDYASLGNSVTIPVGSSSVNLTVNPIADGAVEGAETVVVTLAASAAYAIGSPGNATVTIFDDEASPANGFFVASKVLGTLRNNFGGWVGMKITVGATPLTVTDLGRIFVSGNSGVHTVKLVRASDQTDVPNGSVSLAMNGGTGGQFKYGTLSSPVTLAANTTYYLASQEAFGGDQWYDANTTVNTTSVGSCDGGVYFSGSWNTAGNANNSYGLVDFRYGSGTGGSLTPTVSISASDATAAEPGSDTATFTITRTGSTAAALTVNYVVSGTATAGSDYTSLGSSVSIPLGSSSGSLTVRPIDDSAVEGAETVVVTLAANAAYAIGSPDNATVTIFDDEASPANGLFVVSKVLGTLRNNFGGWAGMKLTVGANAVAVTELGRIFVSGNSGVHTVKLVRASDQTDVPNGSVSIAMSGGTPGQFKYGTLSSPVTLAANAIYYLVSQEVEGGDQWYDAPSTTVTTTSVGSCNGGAYSGSGNTWSVVPNANHTYLPVDFKFTSATTPSFVVSKVLGTLRNNFGGWAGMKLTVGATGLTVTELGRIFINGNSGVHTVKLVRASDQADVPNGSVAITMSGGTPGQFKYGTLSSPVTLAANTMYYLASEEVAGGDQWYDVANTTVTTASVGSCNGGVYLGSSYPWKVVTSANHTYVPVDFKYTGSGNPLPPPLAASSPFRRMGEPTAEVSLSGSLENGVFEVTLTGEPGQTYSIEASENLHVWSPIDTVTLTRKTATLTDRISTNQPYKFYRAVCVR